MSGLYSSKRVRQQNKWYGNYQQKDNIPALRKIIFNLNLIATTF